MSTVGMEDILSSQPQPSQPEQNQQNESGWQSSSTTNRLHVVVAGVLVSFLIIIVLGIFLRILRARYPNPRYVPTPWLKRVWKGWNVPSKSSRLPVTNPNAGINALFRLPSQESGARRANHMRLAQDDFEDVLAEVQQMHQHRHHSASVPGAGGGDAAISRPSSTHAAGTGDLAHLARQPSARSVATLPAYHAKATESEAVIGYEGERDGIDCVVEAPPTPEAAEALREAEMDALYRLRLARRQQIADREDRRRLRHAARERQDTSALAELRRRARIAMSMNAAEAELLRADHERARRARIRAAVSSVAYADVGIARLDGTRVRVRAPSDASSGSPGEMVELLSDAASIAATARSRAGTTGTNGTVGTSDALLLPPQQQQRSSSIRGPDDDLGHRRQHLRRPSSLMSDDDDDHHVSLPSGGEISGGDSAHSSHLTASRNSPPPGGRASSLLTKRGRSPSKSLAESSSLRPPSPPSPRCSSVASSSRRPSSSLEAEMSSDPPPPSYDEASSMGDDTTPANSHSAAVSPRPLWDGGLAPSGASTDRVPSSPMGQSQAASAVGGARRETRTHQLMDVMSESESMCASAREVIRSPSVSDSDSDLESPPLPRLVLSNEVGHGALGHQDRATTNRHEGILQLPALQLDNLPQIVIEPFSAHTLSHHDLEQPATSATLTNSQTRPDLVSPQQKEGGHESWLISPAVGASSSPSPSPL